MKYCDDMSGYMQTGSLLHSAYLLASDSVGVYVHTTKPSIRGVFAFGSLGRLHNVLYDLDCANLYSDLYGICPGCDVGGKKLFPYRTGHDVRSSASFTITGEKHLHFDPAENGLVFENLPLYAEGQMEAECTLPLFAVSVQENRIRIYVKFPEGAEETSLHLPWYPLYDTYTADGVRKAIQYYKHGFYGIFPEGYKTEGHAEILLEDSLSRQAGLRITAEKGSLSLCSRTVPTMGNATILSTDGTAQDGELDITITIVPAAVTVHGSHYYPCSSEAEVHCTENGVVSVKKFVVPEEPGVHALPLGGGREYLYCAVPEKRQTMKKAADGCLALFWRDGNLTGTPPYAFDPVLLEPRTRSGMRYCSHGMRTMSCLAAEGVHADDISYVDAAAHAIRQIAAVSHHGEDGSVFTPLLMDDNGDPGAYKWASRPSDAGIVIRGLVHAAKGYIHFHKKDKAEECVRLARAYARTIEKMQNPDGSFYDRYCYPTLEPAVQNKGTVNNWCLQLWKLLPLLRSFGMDTDADEILALIRRYIRYQTEKENSILYISGGGEDASDFGDALNTDATLFTIQYLLTRESKWKEYAEQALKKSWLLSCMWADMPQFFGLYGNSDLGDFYDQPHGMFSAGGMHDLTAVEANLFAAEALDSVFGRDMADRLHSARLSSFIRENGGMYMVMLQCPNYAHRDDRHSETLMYGGVGVYAWTEAERKSEPIRQLLAQYTFLPEQEKAEV